MAATFGTEVGRPAGFPWHWTNLRKSSALCPDSRMVTFSGAKSHDRNKLGLLVSAAQTGIAETDNEVTLLNHGGGNVRSIRNAIRLLGFNIHDVHDAKDIENAKHLISPGGGAFAAAMEVLTSKGLADPLRDYISQDRPFLGICLGLQLMFEYSEEHGHVEGLGAIPGAVARFDTLSGLQVPHIGWNILKSKQTSKLLEAVDGRHLYFVHSYHAVPSEANNEWVLATSDYGGDFTAAVKKGNVHAVQFHSEKSGVIGLDILKRFLGGESSVEAKVTFINITGLRDFPLEGLPTLEVLVKDRVIAKVYPIEFRVCFPSDKKGSTLLGTSPITIAGEIEEERLSSKLQAMPSSLASGAAAEDGGGNAQVSRISSLDLVLSSGDLMSRECRPISADGRPTFRPGWSSAGESSSWVSTKEDVSSNIISQICQQLHLGLVNNLAAVGKFGVMMSVLGLHVCSQAWAGTEVGQINASAGLDLGVGDFSDIQSGFASAFLLIFFSEIGDKTFFIAALLATRKSGVAVFSGTFGALIIMTLISVSLGRVFHYVDAILPSFGDTKLPVDDIAAVILLIYFGVSTLLEAASMEDSPSGEEQQEAELAIANVGAGGAVAGTVAATFALVFVAEWGDKSFFSTIALAAASSPLGVVSGAIAGHGAATLLAVLGGSFLGNYISEKTIAYVGGVLFLVFAGVTLAEILD